MGLTSVFLVLKPEVDFRASSDITLALPGSGVSVMKEWNYNGKMDSYLISLNLEKMIPINYFGDGWFNITIDLEGSIRESYDNNSIMDFSEIP
ncbi:MAG: hypothetical protein KAR44_07660 [Candidatus Aegiribacteria sp.]|nr:hypothetical protein [Candidatus Aegiribacteria sp.]